MRKDYMQQGQKTLWNNTVTPLCPPSMAYFRVIRRLEISW